MPSSDEPFDEQQLPPEWDLLPELRDEDDEDDELGLRAS